MTHVFEELYATIWKQVFPGHQPLDVELAKKLFAADFSLPKIHTSTANESPIYISDEYGYKQFITQEETEKRANTDNFLEQKVPITNLHDILEHVKKIGQFRGSRTVNSELVEESDDIYSSSYIYNSTHIYSSQKLMFCYNNRTCEYLLASKNSIDSSFGIRLIDSSATSGSFDIHWSGKCANSYFLHDCYDLRDCMFCFHLVSKQFCIGNIQFTEEEYKTLKEKILKEYFAQLSSPNAFVLLHQI